MKTMILRRGLDPWYYFFTEVTAKANGMTVVIDRRVRERRFGVPQSDVERRTSADRRAEPPATWTRDGVMVIDR